MSVKTKPNPLEKTPTGTKTGANELIKSAAAAPAETTAHTTAHTTVNTTAHTTEHTTDHTTDHTTAHTTATATPPATTPATTTATVTDKVADNVTDTATTVVQLETTATPTTSTAASPLSVLIQPTGIPSAPAQNITIQLPKFVQAIKPSWDEMYEKRTIYIKKETLERIDAICTVNDGEKIKNIFGAKTKLINDALEFFLTNMQIVEE